MAKVTPSTLVIRDVFSADALRGVVAEQNPDLLPLLGNANTDWQKEIYRTGITSNLNLSIQGSLFDKLPARLSLGRTIQEGLRLTSKFERNTGSISLNPTFFDNHLKVSLNANGTLEKNRFAAGEEGNAITFDPTQPVYDENSPFGGFFQYYNDNNDGIINENDLIPLAPFNPVANLLQTRSISDVKLEEIIKVDDSGAELSLNGASLRKTYMVIDAYVGGLYLETPSHDENQILKSDEHRRMLFHVLLRKVTARKVAQQVKETIRVISK